MCGYHTTAIPLCTTPLRESDSDVDATGNLAVSLLSIRRGGHDDTKRLNPAMAAGHKSLSITVYEHLRDKIVWGGYPAR